MADTTSKIKIGALLSKAVHRPCIELKGGKVVPLYARAESYNGKEEDADYIHDEEWIAACSKKYSSPNNIRRIMIGNRKVGIQYFSCVGNDPRWVVRSLEECIEPTLDTVYAGSATEFLRRYAMSNLEELYFDTGVLEAILKNGVTSYSVSSVNELFSICKSNIEQGISVLKDIMYIEMLRGDSIGAKKIVDKYNRIRAIGFVSQLDSKIEMWDANGRIDDNEEEMWGALKVKTPSIVLAGKQLESKWGTVTVDGVKHKYNENFTLRTGLYRFDDEKLRGYVQAYKNKMYSTSNSVKSEKKTDLEILLDKESRPESIIKALMLTNGKSSVVSSIEAMSEDGKAKYLKFVQA